MNFFLTALILSLVTFIVISCVFRSDLKSNPRLRVQIDAVMVGVLLFLFVFLTGVLGEADPLVALYGLAGVLLALTVYRSAIGWPSRRLIADACGLPSARKRKPVTTVRGPEDDLNWPNYRP